MARAADIIGQHQQNSEALVRAAVTVGIPVWIAAAVIEKESRGANVYGNDRGGVYSEGRGRPPGGLVTAENFPEFERRVRNGETSNGVGPAQITFPGYFPQARTRGLKLWVPFDNMRLGFEIMRGYLGGDYSNASIRRAGGAYNGNITYGDALVVVAEKWRGRLAGSSEDTAGEFMSALTPAELRTYAALWGVAA